MTRLAVRSKPRTELDHVRVDLDRVEASLNRLSGTGPAAVEFLFLLDDIVRQLEQLEAVGADVRIERGRLEAVSVALRRQARSFLREVGPALEVERARQDVEAEHPWWHIDQSYARERRQKWTRTLLAGLLVILAIGGAWFVYDRYVAPPPETRQALRHIVIGQEHVSGGRLEEALAEYEAAAGLVPDDPEALLWIGILHQEMGNEEAAQAAYETARGLVPEESFYFQRGMFLLEVGNLELARADAEAAVDLAPDWGYGFYLQASVEALAGELGAAVADYQSAADLARAADDVQLEAAARAQLALLLQNPDGE